MVQTVRVGGEKDKGAEMKLVTFMKEGQEEREGMLGVLLEGDAVLQLQPAAALYLHEVEKEKKPYRSAFHSIPGDMGEFLRRGTEAMNLTRLTLDFIRKRRQEFAEPGKKKGLKGRRGETLIFPLSEIRLRPPVPRPGKIIAMGLNFYDHAKEVKAAIPQSPRAFLKVSSSLTGFGDPVPYPRLTSQLDYEVEIAVVIGKKGKDIPQEKAFEYIAGYTIFNDLSCRDLQRKEATERPLYLAKNLDALGPMGPALVTRDEIADPQTLAMELYVNRETEPRQKSTPGQMIFKIPELVAFWSQMTLEPGDIITSGTPGGVAASRQPDPGPWFLKPGDIVEARIEGLGALRNPIT